MGNTYGQNQPYFVSEEEAYCSDTQIGHRQKVLCKRAGGWP